MLNRVAARANRLRAPPCPDGSMAWEAEQAAVLDK
jgi:hypothetical protein